MTDLNKRYLDPDFSVPEVDAPSAVFGSMEHYLPENDLRLGPFGYCTGLSYPNVMKDHELRPWHDVISEMLFGGSGKALAKMEWREGREPKTEEEAANFKRYLDSILMTCGSKHEHKEAMGAWIAYQTMRLIEGKQA